MIVGARIELVKPLCHFSPSERERLANNLSSIAADILKGAAGRWSIRYVVEYEPDYGD